MKIWIPSSEAALAALGSQGHPRTQGYIVAPGAEDAKTRAGCPPPLHLICSLRVPKGTEPDIPWVCPQVWVPFALPSLSSPLLRLRQGWPGSTQGLWLVHRAGWVRGHRFMEERVKTSLPPPLLG